MIERETTEELLGRSLLELSETRPFRKITVGEIVGNCGLSKRTFYNHFSSKAALADYLVDSMVRRPFGDWREGRVSYEDMQLEIFRTIAARRSSILNIWENAYGVGSPFDAMAQVTLGFYEDYLRERLGTDELPGQLEFELRFSCNACMRAMYDWHEGESGVSIETLSSWCVACLPEGLRPYFLEGDDKES